jgi:hypothetical protein
MNFQLTSNTVAPFIISNAVAIVILWFSVGNKGVAKRLLSLLFIGAGVFNLYTAFQNPASYLSFADTDMFGWYSHFIRGFFSQHTTVIVSAISIAQFYVGISIMMTGNRFILACIGGIIFGLLIAPLGVGSAFPSSLVLSIAFLTLLVSKAKKDVEEVNFNY